MTNETMNTNTTVKPTKVTKTVRISTKKSILIKFALIQFFGLVLLAIAIVTVAILFTRNKAEAAGESETETKTEVQYVEVEKPVEKIVEKEVEVKVVDQEAVNNLANEKANELFEDYKANYEPETVEIEKIVTETVTVEVPVEKIVEVEKIIEKEIPVEKIVTETVTVEVPVEKVVEVEKVIEVVDQEATQALATEMAQQMFTVLKENYVAQADEEATEAAVEAKYTELANTYMAQADNEEVLRLATEMANQMLEEYKVEYIEAQEAARVANLSTIYVHVYGGSGKSNSFYLAIEGSLYDRLTYAMIYEVLQADVRFEGYKVRSITNKDAVEVFVGENYTSTRAIRIELK